MQNKIFILAALLLYINLSKGRIGHFPNSDELPDEATPFRHLLSNADLTPELMLEWESDTTRTLSFIILPGDVAIGQIGAVPLPERQPGSVMDKKLKKGCFHLLRTLIAMDITVPVV